MKKNIPIKSALIVSLFCMQSLAMETKNDSRRYLFRLGSITQTVGNRKDVEKFEYIKKYLIESPNSKAIIRDENDVIIDFKVLLEEIEPGASSMMPAVFVRFVNIAGDLTREYFEHVVDSIPIYRGIFKLANMLQHSEILKLLREHNQFGKKFSEILNKTKGQERFDRIYDIIMDQTTDSQEKIERALKILPTMTKTPQIHVKAIMFVLEFKKAAETERITKRFLKLFEKMKTKKDKMEARKKIKYIKEMDALIKSAKNQYLPQKLIQQMEKDFKYIQILLGLRRKPKKKVKK